MTRIRVYRKWYSKVLGVVFGLTFPISAHASEIGFLLGGGFDLKDSTDTFNIQLLLGDKWPGGPDGHLHFLSPLIFKFSTDTPPGVSIFAIAAVPGLEYDIPLVVKSAFITPSFGISLEYWNANVDFFTTSQSTSAFVLG